MLWYVRGYLHLVILHHVVDWSLISKFHIMSYILINTFIVPYHAMPLLISCHIAQRYTLYYVISHHIILCHIMIYHIISYHIIFNYIKSYHTISYHIILNHITSYHIISNLFHHITSHHFISYFIIIT